MKKWKITFTNGEGNCPSIFGDFVTFAEAATFAYFKKNSTYKGFSILSVSSEAL